MRLFEQRIGVAPSYVHDVEKKGLLPSPDKLEALISVFREVAEDQRADPEEDVRQLTRAHTETVLVERWGVEPEFAEVMTLLRELSPEARADLMPTLRNAVPVYQFLNQPERRALDRTLAGVIRFLAEDEGVDFQRRLMDLAKALDESLEAVRDERALEARVPHQPLLPIV
jgi:hypothetical protein